MTLRFFLALPLLLTLSQPSLGAIENVVGEVKKLIAELEIQDTQKQEEIIEDFEDLLNKRPLRERKEVISEIVAQLATAEGKGKIAAATFLSQMFANWEATDQDAAIATVYNTLMNAKDDTLKRRMDDALANAKGLYYDAISQYNTIGRFPNMDAEVIAEKFENMAKLEASRFAGNAAFYLGQLWVRVAIVRGGDRAGEKFKDYLNRSNAAFDKCIVAMKEKKFVSRQFDADARFFRALNDLLSDNAEVGVKNAIEKLNELRIWATKKEADDDETIYVYQLFYSSNVSTRIDRFFSVRGDFLPIVIEFLRQNPAGWPLIQSRLAVELKGSDRKGASKR